MIFWNDVSDWGFTSKIQCAKIDEKVREEDSL